PAEIAARTAPPEASLISVPVEKRTLSSDVVVRGTVRYGAPQQVTLPVSALKKSSGILTTAPVKGKELAEGDVAFTVSGRPVFVLQGAQPAYRDMGPGAQGEDVRQLEEALVRLGFNPGAADGAYDARTASAVSAWYLKSSSAPLGPTEDQIALLRAEQSDSIAVHSEVLAAQEALAAAQRDLALARQRAGITPVGPGGPLPPAASAADQAARARAEQQRVQAALAVARTKRTLDQAIETERQAQARMEEARNRQPPPSNEEYQALSRESRMASERVAMARDEFAAAQEAAASLGVPTDGTTGPSPAEVAQAARDAATAARDAKLESATAQAEVDKAENAVNFARRRVALLTGRPQYSLTAGKLGIQVPADEVLFFPGLPLRVDDVKLQPGDETLGAVMTVTNSRLVIESALTLSDSKLVREGASVGIRAPDIGIDARGTVTRVATAPGTNGVDPQRFFLEVTPDDITATLLGASVVQTISVESTEGEVLAVPVGALSETADGRTRVQVEGAGGKNRWVVVTPGLAAKGLVAVTPVSGDLERGDRVIVGSSGSSKAKGARDRDKK
ncbi:MAG TPA: peptidoglycan-binding domain-containing protein, partial [Actinomycetes bacterium]|nr:peptidoglycan-binding domain-containing protein [Actinomycetes bacterium]